jgi:hypothetical protein
MTSWRLLERILIAFFASHRIRVDDAAGEPRINVVRYRDGNEVVTATLSLERFAKHLAEHFEIPVSSGKTCRTNFRSTLKVGKQMSNLVNKTEFESERPRVIRGVRVSYDDKKVPSWSFKDGTPWQERLRLLVVFMTLLNQEWSKDNLPVTTVLPDADGKLPPIGPLNDSVPKKKWRQGMNGELVGPWVRQYLVRLIDPSTYASYTYVNSTLGAMKAYEELADKIDLARQIRGKVYPLVELAEAIFPTKWGERRRPSFRVCDWLVLGPPAAAPKQLNAPAVLPGLQSVPEPTTAEVIQDAIRDFNDPVDNI